MAISQTGIYKQDIAQLTALTVTRQDCYHGIAAMGLTILTAIYCPGKLGFHVPPPPGWLMGLEFVNIAGCYLFLGLTLWFAMHASMRADTAATHMLTRFVRLPIPSQGMLDKARKFLASYEEQPLEEVFRIPFTRHQAPSGKSQGGYNMGVDIDDAARARSRHGFDVPAWYRKEKAIDNVNTSETIESMMPLAAQGEGPEHFNAYREIQMEWFPYDVYARLCIHLAFMHLLHCWSYLQIGHLLQELRAVYACAIVMLPMFVLQQVIMTLDIIPDGLPIHRLGPFALWFAYFAAVIEYKRWYDPWTQKFGFVLVYCAYAIHIIYTIQLYRLCRPSEEAPSVAESPGASWWPGEWRLPKAFQHAIWLVAPPKETNEHDIVGELRDMQTGPSKKAAGAPHTDGDRRADVHRSLGKQGESPAWFSVKVGLISLLIAWVWLVAGFTWEVLNQGTSHPSMLSAPGLANNARDPRYRPAKPGKAEHTEVGTGGVRAGPAKGVHMEAMHRRLDAFATLSASGAAPSAAARQGLTNKLRELLPVLQGLAHSGAVETSQAVADLQPAPEHVAVQWPALFEPQILVCGAEATVALSRHGRGAHLKHGSSVEAVPFALHGVVGHGALVAAHWDTQGLLLVTAAGAVLECAGAGPTGGRWACAALPGAALPLDGTAKVALSRATSGALRAAVLFAGEASVTVFVRGPSAAKWLIHGEVRAPVAPASAAFVGEDLLLGAADGSISKLHMVDGSMSEMTPANSGHDGHAWSSACQRPSGELVRLAVPTTVGSEARLILG
eukprot:CAMPEP_0183505298 /NCGR_PEP_ID=MMETSP0371-20130417/6611_1 /TAXON_ID=268820 /ORGANISM="Peridinium aciculiferum, Strain PAER-2" /LENGTH=783 /DNA_ID=CAMNT_0025700973 /DNA_START=28 /DNA_END=2379 /DNA_ORIENTATION=-